MVYSRTYLPPTKLELQVYLFFLDLFGTVEDITKLRKNLMLCAIITIIFSTLASYNIPTPIITKNSSLSQFFTKVLFDTGFSTLLGILNLVTCYFFITFLLIAFREHYKNKVNHFTTANDSIKSLKDQIRTLHQNLEQEVILEHEVRENIPEYINASNLELEYFEKITKLETKHQITKKVSASFLTATPLLLACYAITISFKYGLAFLVATWPF